MDTSPITTMFQDAELQEHLLPSERESTSSKTTFNLSRACFRFTPLLIFATLTFGVMNCCYDRSLQKKLPHPHPPHHGHVSYQATLQKNEEIEYSREFTVPCDYGILVFNVGPAAETESYHYEIYQDAYVFSNNKKMCWAYPTYRGIQRGPFPWWVQGDPTSFDVPVGMNPVKISHRVVKPKNAKNVSITRGGDYLIIGHHKFYTPEFYHRLKATINGWDAYADHQDYEGSIATLSANITVVDLDNWYGGDLEVLF